VPDLTVLFTIIIILYVNEVPRFFSWLGLISYSLYLFHGPVIVRVLQWAQIHLHSVAGREGMVIAGYLLSMVAGTVFYFLAEKKCKALADRIKYRRSDANLTQN
jgi:peptidoglycan/LPS O-acetylase OafA/YrhL